MQELQDALVRLPVIYRIVVVLHDAEETTGDGSGDPWLRSPMSRAWAWPRPSNGSVGRMMLVDALAQGQARREALGGVPLRCWDARSKVSDYLDDGLPASDRVLVEGYIEACPTCPPLYATLVGTRCPGRPT
jgi:RNA polymerase sigma-70 factor (ECF subfamily)